MRFDELKPLIAYGVTKDSRNNLLQEGDIVWISKNDDLNVFAKSNEQKAYCGTLSRSEWELNSEVLNSEFEESKVYIVIVNNGKERLKEVANGR